MRPKNAGIRALLLIAIPTVLLAAACGTEEGARPAGPPEPPSTIVTFDAQAREFTEGVIVDGDGNVFVSISGSHGRVVRIESGSTTAEEFGKVEGLAADDFPGLIGLAVDEDGNVYGGVVSKNPAANGVWRFDAESGDASRLKGTEAIPFANGVIVDADTVYITDTTGADGKGAVWRVPENGTAAIWAQSDLLAGNGSAGFGFPIGPNGIDVHDGSVYVGMTETARIAAIPIEDDGSAGEISIFADLTKAGPGGVPAAVDGIDIDDDGNIYVASPIIHTVLKVSSDGKEFSTVADATDGLDCPSHAAIGDDGLYIVNFSGGLGEASNMKGPSIVRVPI